MNLKEAAEIAARERNPVLAAKIADFLRDKLDMTFDQSWQVIEGWTKISKATWNEMLRRSDEGYDR